MKKPAVSLLLVLLASASSVALADPWKDESGKGRHGERREHKQEFWDGNCKVERKWEKNGGYKEERKCKGPRRDYSDRRYQDRHYQDRHDERPVVHQRSYAPNSYYYPAPRYDGRAPEVRIDVRVRQ
ncbi:hypothetical protein [Massilia consociata]|uniref:Uncharacterized protein n=1 Tax=Massilia consociata TaxID=760117 RepID=A0ABV6FBS6_9BURK